MMTKNLKIGIIGAGNMGSAIAKALSKSEDFHSADIYISDVNEKNLELIKNFSTNIHTTTSNIELVKMSDIVILAVKPWLIHQIAEEIKTAINYDKQIIVSIAAGVDIKTLYLLFSEDAAIYRVIPNTAIEVSQSLSVISTHDADKEKQELITDVFTQFGKVYFVSEEQLNAFMSLSSCGIAYAFRYIRAAIEGGVELGIAPQTAKEVVIQTLRGAIELIEKSNSHPEVEIDKVTTPGGITIKGLNEMEAYGFTNAVIKGLKASHIK